MKNILFLVVTLAFTFVSCVKKTSGRACSYNECGIVAPVSEQNSVEAYLTANTIVAAKHCSGLYYKIDVAGTGVNPTACSNVSVKYKGTLTNGNVFDQQTSPISFNLQSLITAWKKWYSISERRRENYLVHTALIGLWIATSRINTTEFNPDFRN